ncbi:hypothetical protein LSH36_670g01000, partial [Paralvinella palmiformis]
KLLRYLYNLLIIFCCYYSSRGLVAEKANDALFFVDTSGSELKQDDPAPRKNRTFKPLKCHALLEPDANIKPIRVPRNVKKTAPQRKRKVKQGQANQANTLQNKRQKRDESDLTVAEIDLWCDKGKGEEGDEFYLRQTKKKTPKPPSHLTTKSSVLPSVEVPHPGSSYNPLYEEYQDLLNKALEVEKQKEKEELRLKRTVDDLISKVTVQELKERWMKEMSSGINDDDLSDHSEDVDRDNDRLSVNPPVRREDKKTERQRRKEQEEQAKEKLAALEKTNKLRKFEILRIKRIKTEVEQRTLALKKRQELKAAKREEKMKKPKKLGKYKYKEPELEIKLSDELPDSLRHLKPEGHLLEDRLKSLQKRNIIEPRQRVKSSRRYKRKTYIKKSHKFEANLIRNA